MGAVPRQTAGNVSGIKRRTENSAEGRTRLDGRGGSLHCFAYKNNIGILHKQMFL